MRALEIQLSGCYNVKVLKNYFGKDFTQET